MKNTFIKVISLILVLMLCFSIVACVKQPDNGDESSSDSESKGPEATAGPSDSDSESGEEVTTAESDDLPDLNYGKTVTILYWSDVEKVEFVPKNDAEWDMSDTVQKALYSRNETVESRLGVTLQFEGTAGNASNVSAFVSKAKTDIASASPVYDIFAAYSRTGGNLASNGCLVDLSNSKYIDTTKAYYPDKLINNLKVGDALYFVSGDASVNTLYLMYTIYFNKNIAEETFKIDPNELYGYVQNKTWTIDKLIELTQNTYANLDGDDEGAATNDVDDQYGFCTIYYGVDAFYTGSGFKLVESNGTGDKLLTVSSDFVSEASVNLVKKLGAWLQSENTTVAMSNSSVWRTPFVQGTALFCQERCYLAENYLLGQNGGEGVDFKYGVLPTPLLDESQEDYITCAGNPFTLYSISVGAKKKSADTVDMLGAVIECWSSESYRLTTPALFEVIMQLRYSQDSIDAEMFDICRSTLTTDLGRIFSADLSNMSEMWSKAACNNSNWSRDGALKVNSLSKVLEKLSKSFTALQG